jgi:hypothetical protein
VNGDPGGRALRNYRFSKKFRVTNGGLNPYPRGEARIMHSTTTPRSRRNFLPVLLLSASLLAAPVHASTWDFESPIVGGYSYGPPVSAQQPWTFTGDSGIAVSGAGFNASGTTTGQFAFVQTGGGGNMGGFSQAITISGPGNYRLNFQVGGRIHDTNFGGAANYSVTVSGGLLAVSGSTTDAQTFSSNSYVFTVPEAGAYTLTFANTGPAGSLSDETVFFDNIEILANTNQAPAFVAPSIPEIPAGETWTPRDSGRNWNSITSSADGTRLAATVSSGQIYTSTDSGVTWTPRDSARGWTSISSSADGIKLVATVSNGLNGGIYTSTDSGVSWTSRTSGPWTAVVSSGDGAKQAASYGFSSAIYTSSDSGVTWTARPISGSHAWKSIASSADGTKLAAVANNSLIYTSVDSGVTWTARESSRQWSAITSSTDGTRLAAVVNNGQIYTSVDSGVTWAPQASGTRAWTGITSSADGSKLAAVSNNGQIHTSTNSGVTWTAWESSRNWKSITSSADGLKLAAVVGNGQIYTSEGQLPSLHTVTAPAGADPSVTLNFVTHISSGSIYFPEPGQAVSFMVTNDNPAIFATPPSISPDGTLTFAPSATPGTATVTVVAHDDGGTANGGVDTSAPQTFVIVVTPAAAIAVDNLADGTGQINFGSISPGNSAVKTVTISNVGTADLTGLGITIDGADAADFTLTASPTAPIAPGGSTTFAVTFTPTTSGPKTAALHITSNDPNENSFDLTLRGARNTAPVLELPGSPVIVQAKSAAGATVNYGLTATDAEDGFLVPVFDPANGSVLPLGDTTVNAIVTDSDGMSASGSFIVRVLPGAQDKKAPAVVIAAPSTPVTSPATITGTVKDDFALLSLEVKLNGLPVALDAPLVSAPNTALPWSVSGVTPENGSNVIEAVAVDWAGHTTRTTRTFNYVNVREDLAGTYLGLLKTNDTPDLDTTGLVMVTVTKTGSFSGKVTFADVSVPFSGLLNNAGEARFKPSMGVSFALIDQTEFFSYLGALTFSVSKGRGLSGTLSTQSTGGTVLATFAGEVAPYSKANPVAASWLNLPLIGTATTGRYTIVFPNKEQSPTLAQEAYPQGDGFATLTLSSAGAVSLSGYLADGTRYTAAGKLRADGTVPLFTSLYRKRGSISGELAFADPVAGSADNDVSGANFLWLRPAIARAGYYRDGWPTGLHVDAVGGKYAAPASCNFGQDAANPTAGNANLVFADGLLSGPVGKAISVDPLSGAVKLNAATAATCKFTLSTGTGMFSGTFKHTDNSICTYRGIVLNKGANRGGFGYFLSTPSLTYGAGGQGGGVSLAPFARE